MVGDALRYQDANGTELPAGMWVAMREESVFDVASLTKLFTATVLMTLVEEGLLALDAPIAEHLPSFASGDRRAVTLRRLLSHTSGLPDLLRLWTDWPDLGVARARGPYMGTRVWELVYGNSWSLGGTVGNAGIFNTAADLARFGETLRRGGEVDDTRILRDATVSEMFRDQLPEGIDPGFRHGLGFRIGEETFMGVLAASGAVGHTGFTGTSLVIDSTAAS